MAISSTLLSTIHYSCDILMVLYFVLDDIRWRYLLDWLLTIRAYRDGEIYAVLVIDKATNFFIAETLDRFKTPFFGRLASSILDDE